MKNTPLSAIMGFTSLVFSGVAIIYIVRAVDSTSPEVLSNILGYAFGIVAAVGLFILTNKYVAPKVEATDTAWDGFALLIGGTVGITVLSMLAALLGMWLGSVIAALPA